jgi:hypothetical protein
VLGEFAARATVRTGRSIFTAFTILGPITAASANDWAFGDDLDGPGPSTHADPCPARCSCQPALSRDEGGSGPAVGGRGRCRSPKNFRGSARCLGGSLCKVAKSLSNSSGTRGAVPAAGVAGRGGGSSTREGGDVGDGASLVGLRVRRSSMARGRGVGLSSRAAVRHTRGPRRSASPAGGSWSGCFGITRSTVIFWSTASRRGPRERLTLRLPRPSLGSFLQRGRRELPCRRKEWSTRLVRATSAVSTC